jgi:hypothetical protein
MTDLRRDQSRRPEIRRSEIRRPAGSDRAVARVTLSIGRLRLSTETHADGEDGPPPCLMPVRKERSAGARTAASRRPE